jgi:hypothetical protein
MNSIANYADLVAAVGRWINRNDLDAVIPDFIAIAESRIALRLRVPQMVKATTLTQLAGTGSVEVPDDWLEWDTVRLGERDLLLEYIPPVYMAGIIASGSAGNFGQYTMDGTNLVVTGTIDPGAPDLDINVSYYARIPPLNGTQNSNWLLTLHPEVYLYGALVSGWQYVLNEPRAAQNATLFDNTIQLVNDAATVSKLSGSIWRQRRR